ncbi:methylase involved in ubiquinone/menaquinone biosynthesis [Synechococcus sp. PCC 7502]|uniref:class I SAM-dependent methyltransferase n=1 Tax=Synechococcus sp. PCC 7502 TaxID=1173263 RepID=UPI00029FA6C0|nr:class I SAM-dependent methyltransferase [Synechococcus sp. PCC 7502]AFY73729.1 methylase involved in ubiquinone/menaquinone biosynthesis [Synechococcus sp. PCC 7502]
MDTNKVTDAETRFSSRVMYYNKYRPSYPNEIIGYLSHQLDLSPSSVIADIGSGTGILSELFLKNGNQVFGVEPNREMRTEAESLLKLYPNFTSIDGSAELTTLKSLSIDFIVAGQSFHWFDLQKARREFLRLLNPQSWVVLIWNDRQTDTTPFLKAYEYFLLKNSTDYEQVNHKNVNEDILNEFFGHSKYQLKQFPNEQIFDYDGLLGRTLSSSYIPLDDNRQFKAMTTLLQELFAEHSSNGVVNFKYDTKLYYGHLT